MDIDDEALAHLVGAGERLPESVSGRILRRVRAVIPALLEVLEDEELAREDWQGGGYAPIHAATLLQELQADEAIEPMLRVLSRCDPMDILYSTLIHALESLGPPVLEPALAAHAAAVSEEQKTKVRAVEGARERARAPLLAIGASEDDDEDEDRERERERAEVPDRFSESPHAAGADFGWIDLSLTYAAEHEGASFSAIDARTLRTVLFELFPRKGLLMTGASRHGAISTRRGK